MSTLTVLLARAGTADGVLDVLQDLSAVGLLDPFLWVVEHDVARSAVPATEVRGGRRRRTTLQNTVAATNFRTVRLAVLVPLLGDAAAPDHHVHQGLSELLTSSAGGADITRVRMLIARPGGPSVESATIEGWHNLLIAPEDSRGPSSGHVLLAATDDTVGVGQHAAPAIASALGMWTDVDHAPVDGVAPAPGQVVRMVRSFYRRFDTTRAEAELRRQVFDASGTLPLPRQRGSSVSYIDDAALATRTMAEALWTKHRSVLRGPRVTPPAVKTKAIGILEAIKMFFGFIVAALKNAPSEWYAGLIRRTSSAVASAVHSTVYGSAPSAYAVVFNGVTADGTPAGMSDFNDASARLGDLMSDSTENREHEARADLSALWDDFADGALTLADAGERAQGLPPVQIGANRGVLRSVSDCVPSESDRFVVPNSVAAVIGIESLSPSDYFGLTTLVQKLRGAEADPLVGVDARGALNELQQWAAVHGRSYGGQVGRILVDSIGNTMREVRELLARIKARGDADDLSNEIRDQQRKLALLMKIFSALFVVALVVLGALIGLELLSLVWGVGCMVAALMVFVVTSVATFTRGQRDLFRELARRQSDSDQASADKANLRTALRDLNRQCSAYGQYLAWSKALGSLLREPFGPAADNVVDRAVLGFGLPLSTKVGSARPSVDAVANAGLQVRRDLFSVGWLTPVWQQLIADSGNGLGALGQDVRENPRLLFSDEGEASGSPLDIWSTRLARGEVTSNGSAALWDTVITTLATPGSIIGTSLSELVETVTDGERQVVRIDEFLAGLDSDNLGMQYFDDELFTDTATAAGDNRVADNVRSSVAIGLGSLAVVTQFSDAVPEFQFRFCDRPFEVPGFDDQGPSEFPGGSQHTGVGPPEPWTTQGSPTAAEPPGSGTYVF